MDSSVAFVKLHASWELLLCYAELLGFRMPVKVNPLYEDADDDVSEHTSSFAGRFFDYDRKLIPRETKYYRAKISSDKLSLFIVGDRETFFSPAQRSRIMWEVMIRTYFGSSPNMRGISGLLNDGTFKAAYPLHDILHRAWAHPSAWYRHQPIHLIRRYFGEKTGFYFAWLGFYTSALLPPAVLGIFVCLHGFVELYTSVPIHDTCENKFSDTVIMCPNCLSCKLLTLRQDLCASIKVNAFFDNTGAVIFSIFMSVWARIFIKLWKKRESTLVFEWAVPEDEMGQEEINPDLEATAAIYRLNPVTMDYEPYIPLWERVARTLSAASVVIFMIFLVFVAVFGIIVYRSVMEQMLNRHTKEGRDELSSALQNPVLSSKAVASATASLVNLICIWLLSFVYEKIARGLTHMERQRTISDFENSYTVKMFLFQSVNHYIGLFYIAFLKGRFQGHPGQTASILDADMETCDGGCLYEVFLQLFIIMVGKQIVNNVQEFLTPVFFRWWKYRRTAASKGRVLTRWEMDYELKEWTMLSLFEEYLEMALQFGFCTLFVAAFPLAPLFALLNNIIEIRIDAYKYVVQQRRPRPQTARNIGVWHKIIEGISLCAVVFNAFFIAFTTEFIPRAMYRLDHGSLDGYVNSTLSRFAVADYPKKPDVLQNNASITDCCT
ncbi:anoctamin-4 [Galendromus occidentalis]|uniref:Anoctamin n=1 Tax=Galendromus occidentalis TaxID=34638 RepID=A0AAJ7SF21_9ACAR|nr:anoctamin-4 [Galendromus occidentalis]